MRALALICILVAPLAAADETHADCERDQPWIGYGTTDGAHTVFEGIAGHAVTPCEGEQWDGQDSVQPSQDPGTGAHCNKLQTAADPSSFFVGSCMSPDPNAGGNPLSLDDPPVGFRVSSRSPGGGAKEIYVATNVGPVARLALYQGACIPMAGSGGLEGAPDCASAVGQDRTAFYYRDNSPGNVVWVIVSSAGLTGGRAGEADCDQATYANAHLAGDQATCPRDNTAVTLDTTLP